MVPTYVIPKESLSIMLKVYISHTQWVSMCVMQIGLHVWHAKRIAMSVIPKRVLISVMPKGYMSWQRGIYVCHAKMEALSIIKRVSLSVVQNKQTLYLYHTKRASVSVKPRHISSDVLNIYQFFQVDAVCVSRPAFFQRAICSDLFSFEPELSAKPPPKLPCIQDQDKLSVKPISVDA